MPLKFNAWKEALVDHPDKTYAGYILRGISEGFCIGFDYGCHSCCPSRGNMISTLENPEVVDTYLQKELSEGNVVEIADPTGLPGLQVSPFSVIPNCEQMVFDC